MQIKEKKTGKNQIENINLLAQVTTSSLINKTLTNQSNDKKPFPFPFIGVGPKLNIIYKLTFKQ